MTADWLTGIKLGLELVGGRRDSFSLAVFRRVKNWGIYISISVRYHIYGLNEKRALTNCHNFKSSVLSFCYM